MKKMLSLVLLGAAVSGCPATAQDAPAVIDAAVKAMGTTSLQSIQYSGTGSVFMVGQNVRPESPWPRFTVIKYNTGVRYDTPAFREELVRIDDENPAARRRGGRLQCRDRPGRHAADPRRADAGPPGDAPHRQRAASRSG